MEVEIRDKSRWPCSVLEGHQGPNLAFLRTSPDVSNIRSLLEAMDSTPRRNLFEILGTGATGQGSKSRSLVEKREILLKKVTWEQLAMDGHGQIFISLLQKPTVGKN